MDAVHYWVGFGNTRCFAHVPILRDNKQLAKKLSPLRGTILVLFLAGSPPIPLCRRRKAIVKFDFVWDMLLTGRKGPLHRHALLSLAISKWNQLAFRANTIACRWKYFERQVSKGTRYSVWKWKWSTWLPLMPGWRYTTRDSRRNRRCLFQHWDNVYREQVDWFLNNLRETYFRSAIFKHTSYWRRPMKL